MTWIWLNVPLALLCVAAWTGIPLWLLHRHPDWHRERGAQPAPAEAGGLVYVPTFEEQLDAALIRWQAEHHHRVRAGARIGA